MTPAALHGPTHDPRVPEPANQSARTDTDSADSAEEAGSGPGRGGRGAAGPVRPARLRDNVCGGSLLQRGCSGGAGSGVCGVRLHEPVDVEFNRFSSHSVSKSKLILIQEIFSRRSYFL